MQLGSLHADERMDTVDLREHIALSYLLWLEDSAVMLMVSMDWLPLAGMA